MLAQGITGEELVYSIPIVIIGLVIGLIVQRIWKQPTCEFCGSRLNKGARVCCKCGREQESRS